MSKSIFRQASLERLSSPERLDSLMEVVNLRAWIALAAAGLVILAGLAWGCLGSLAEEVPGQGILAREGGYFNVEVAGTGPLLKVLVEPNHFVARNQVVALIGRPELEGQLAELERQRDALERQKADTVPLLDQERTAQQAAVREQAAQAEATVRAARERIAFLNLHLKAMGQALDKGLIAPEQLQNVKQELVEAESRLASATSRGHELVSQQAAAEGRLTQRRFELDRELGGVQGRITQLRAQLAAETQVLSPYAGKILEVLKDSGQMIQAGTPLLRLEVDSSPVVGYLLVQSDGKRLQAGMQVQMEPAGIRQEEFGLMRGRVREVSHSPMTVEGIEALLHNRGLANQLGSGGNAYLVEVTPELDPATPSGFRWTSRQGPPESFGSGTLLSGRIQVRKQAPITLVVPAIRKWLRG